MLSNGADKVSINTAAVHNPKLIRQTALKFGSQCIVLAIDANRVQIDGKECWRVYINGGRKATDIDVLEWAKLGQKNGAGEIVLNVMNADGTRAGYDLEMTRRISEEVDIPVVASGGAGNLEHLAEVLTQGKADAALAASIFHFGTYTIAQAKDFLQAKGIPVRLDPQLASAGQTDG